MGPMKRFRLTVVFLMVAALVAGLAPAAQSASSLPNAAAWLLPVGDEPSASGYATVRLTSQRGWAVTWTLVVNCQGLTPGAQYYCVFPGGRSATLTAGASGTWGATGKCKFNGYDPGRIWLYRVDPGRGNVLVLSGTFVWYQR
jgi:hypothetical protein